MSCEKSRDFYFNTKEGEIIFATPKVCPKTLVQITEKLQKIIVFMQSNGFFYRFSFIGNERFEREIIQPLKDVSNEVADTAELFLRSYQFLDLLQKRESLSSLSNGEVSITVKQEVNWMVSHIRRFPKDNCCW